MITPQKMSKITIAGPKAEMKKVIDDMHALKLVHIEDYQKNYEGFDLGNPLEKSDKVSEVLLKVRSMRSQLPKTKSIGTTQSVSLQKLESDVLSALEKNKELDQELTDLRAELKELEPFAALGIGKEAADPYKSILVYVGTVKTAENLENDIKKITAKYELKTADYQKKQLVALFVEKAKSNKIDSLLASYGFSSLGTEPLLKHQGSIESAVSTLRKDIAGIEQEKKKNDIALEQISSTWSSTLESTEKTLEEESEKLQAPLKFATTKNAFVVQGYIPTENVQKLQTKLAKSVGNKIHLTAEDVHHDENVPTALKNPKPVKPFEVLLDMFSLPNYHEFDPAILMFLVFPLFYGFMLGDIGYGLVTLAVFSLLKLKFGKNKQARGLMNILILSSLTSIFFGFLFAEFFGAEQIFGYHMTPVIHRLHDVTALFHISVLIGIVHLNLGFIIGFFNELHHHGFVKAVLEKISWIVMQIGAFGFLTHINMMETFVGNLFSVPIGPVASGALFAVGAVGIVLGEGVKGGIELPAVFSNILSYARLMAVGLASAALAIVVNEMAFGMFRAGIIGIVGGIVILVLGHGINIALGVLSPFLHSLRLHYVEFFGKFYKGGGKKFKPFGDHTDEA